MAVFGATDKASSKILFVDSLKSWSGDISAFVKIVTFYEVLLVGEMGEMDIARR